MLEKTRLPTQKRGSNASKFRSSFEESLAALDLSVEDDEPMESPWQRMAIHLLISLLRFYWRGRDDFYVGGNMFVHFDLEIAQKRAARGPDFFVVKGVDGRRTREAWVVWEEGGHYPNVIIELLSPTTARFDKGEKKQLYQDTFRTPEYFCYTPKTQELAGWYWQHGRYEPLAADENGWLWSGELQLWLGPWIGGYDGVENTWLRFYDRDANLVLTREEAAKAEADRLAAELAHLRAS